MSAEVALSGTLASQVGVRRTYVAVPPDASLSDLVERLVDRYGTQLRAALFDEGTLRSDVVALRQGCVASERLSLDSRISAGDRIRFEQERSGQNGAGQPQPASEFSA